MGMMVGLLGEVGGGVGFSEVLWVFECGVCLLLLWVSSLNENVDYSVLFKLGISVLECVSCFDFKFVFFV